MCRSTSIAVIHHPDVLGISYLPDFQTKAKLNFLASISSSEDPLIQDLSSLTTDNSSSLTKAFLMLPRVFWNLQRTPSLASPGKLLEKLVKQYSRRRSLCKNSNESLCKLSVQIKFLDACDLEKSNRVWARILVGLPAKQLSFILRASTDTLPTPLNQRRWKMRIDTSCDLCKSKSKLLSYCAEPKTFFF